MVAGLERAASLLRSSREYTTVEITSTISCWKDWLGFPFHSALVTQTATVLADWSSRVRNRQMLPSTPLPPQEFGSQRVFGVGGGGRKQTKYNCSSIHMLTLTSNAPAPACGFCSNWFTCPHLSLWCPCVRQPRQARCASLIRNPFSAPSRVHISIQKCPCPTQTMFPRLESIK